ncbi:MAG: DNA polymerase IV [Clostridiales bacterium]|nr:DNA polymerase IV [Clostridiales bacterium]
MLQQNRMILHSDLNNFYASVECLINPKIKDSPVVVVGDVEKRRGVVLAKNYIAKSYGISTGDTVYEAENKCPSGVKLVRCTARHHIYEKISKRVQDIYLRYTDYVEMFGIDEAWLDISKIARDYKEACEIAEMIRCEVKEKIGITVSIGVSYNKIFAKLGSDLKKPDAITLITQGNFRDRIWGLNVNNLLMVGRATNKKLEKMSIRTIGDLAKADPDMLTKYFGVNGKKLWLFANGLDNSPVKLYANRDEIKSIGNSTTCPRDLNNIKDVSAVFYSLAEQVAYRLRKENMYCKEIQIMVRYSDMSSVEHQCKLPYSTDTSKDIATNALSLFNRTCDFHLPIRALGIRLKDFSEQLQTSILDGGVDIAKQEKLDCICDSIRHKYGEGAILRCNNMWNE